MSNLNTQPLAQVFFEIFQEDFGREIEARKSELLPIWKDSARWTELMLGPTGFLSKVATAWASRTSNEQCASKNEWHKFDLMLVSTTGGQEWWQSVPLLTIEHENGDHIQDEVWKLACWRSRLKVLITYHNEHGHEERKRLLSAEIIRNVQSTYDDERTEWLLLSASRTWKDRMDWSGHEWQDGGWRRL